MTHLSCDSITIGQTEIDGDDARRIMQALDRAPLLFTYADNCGAAAIHLGKATRHRLKIILTNTTEPAATIRVKPFSGGGPPSSQHHLRVDFSRGALKGPLTPPQGWKLATRDDDFHNIGHIYLESTEERTLNPGGSLTIHLSYTHGVAERGARETSVTATVGQWVTYDSGSHKGEAVVCSQPDSKVGLVTGESCAEVVPLSALFVGRRTVLNDGVTGNALLLQLRNLLEDDPLRLNPETAEDKTVFTLRFDQAPDGATRQAAYAWALAKKADLNKIVIAPRDSQWTITKDPVEPGWRLTTKLKELKPREVVELDVKNIVTDLAPGSTHLYISYQDLPEFAEAYLVAPLEKTPMRYEPDGGQGASIRGVTEGNVGLAIEASAQGKIVPALELRNSASGRSSGIGVDFKHAGDGRLQAYIRDEITTDSWGTSLHFGTASGANDAATRLTIDKTGNVGLNKDQRISFADNGEIQSFDERHRILFRRAEDKLELRELGDIIFSPGATKGAETAKVVMKADGNVGIGTKTPDARLHVAQGDLKLDKNRTIVFADNGEIQSFDKKHRILFRRAEDKLELRESGDIIFSPGATAGDQTAKVVMKADGKVGIGTTNPDARLHLQGSDKALRLMGTQGTTHYGAKLNFGDKDDVFLWHDQDKKLAMNAKERIVLNAGYVGINMTDPKGLAIKGDVTITGSLTIKPGGLTVQGNIMNEPPGRGYYLTLAATKSDGSSPNLNSWTYWSSDERLKKRIRPIGRAMEKVARLSGVHFRWNARGLNELTLGCEHISAGPGASKEENRTLRRKVRAERKAELSGPQVGVLGQEVQAVLPEAVREDGNGYLEVSYPKLVVLLIEAVKQQKALFDEQAEQIRALRARLDALESGGA